MIGATTKKIENIFTIKRTYAQCLNKRLTNLFDYCQYTLHYSNIPNIILNGKCDILMAEKCTQECTAKEEPSLKVSFSRHVST